MTGAKKGRYDRLRAAIQRRPAPEARELLRLLRRLGGPGSKVSWSRAVEVASGCVLAGDRTLKRRESDRATDRQRRALVGARLPRSIAEVYHQQAEALGWSRNRWATEALSLGYQCLIEAMPTDPEALPPK